MFKKSSKERTLFAVLIIVLAIMTILEPQKFLAWQNFRSMLFQLPEFGIFALAMFIAILTGGINLSVITTATLGGVVSALVMSKMYQKGYGVSLIIVAAILTAVCVSTLCGIVNGYVVAYIGAAAMMATLGTSTFFEGIGLLLSKGNSVSGFPSAFFWFGNGTILGIPVPMILFILIAGLTHILLNRTPWGQSVYMIGCNSQASRFSGINVRRVMLMVYVYSGFIGSIAMIIMMSRYNSARIDYGSAYLMKTVTAAVLGGTVISGGYGKVIGVVMAVVILQVISSGLNIAGLDPSLSTVITGMVLIGVLTLNFLSTKVDFKFKKGVNTTEIH